MINEKSLERVSLNTVFVIVLAAPFSISYTLPCITDALASLASASRASEYRNISLSEIDDSSFEAPEEVLSITLGPSWMDEIVAFLKHDTLPSDKKEAHRVRSKAAYYWISENGQLALNH